MSFPPLNSTVKKSKPTKAFTKENIQKNIFLQFPDDSDDSDKTMNSSENFKESSSKTKNKSSQRDKPQEEINDPELFKTELCEKWMLHGNCVYGDLCKFAHGRLELKNRSRHPKYRTDLCRTFSRIGSCPYGNRCDFLHIMAKDGKITTGYKNSGETTNAQQRKTQQTENKNTNCAKMDSPALVQNKSNDDYLYKNLEEKHKISASPINIEQNQLPNNILEPELLKNPKTNNFMDNYHSDNFTFDIKKDPVQTKSFDPTKSSRFFNNPQLKESEIPNFGAFSLNQPLGITLNGSNVNFSNVNTSLHYNGSNNKGDFFRTNDIYLPDKNLNRKNTINILDSYKSRMDLASMDKIHRIGNTNMGLSDFNNVYFQNNVSPFSNMNGTNSLYPNNFTNSLAPMLKTPNINNISPIGRFNLYNDYQENNQIGFGLNYTKPEIHNNRNLLEFNKMILVNQKMNTYSGTNNPLSQQSSNIWSTNTFDKNTNWK
ncbi:hypothetical protein BB559_006748 [Furculomyces boomerangus]|uniref:C3H1-type domain-containing protein n=1 Tax=Furculomyces boomerangus TaxID=61424 RepID=A0A2T9Y0S5_9FUNG|nr:hypothetical protein BB559_006790 [Furculomyces boomerangus]PVU85935.1 hypothetical protein BB559_006748 [Furculomyces boomerangus]